MSQNLYKRACNKQSTAIKDPQHAASSNLLINEPVLATFVVLAYNQQSLIREAVEGAFAQSYRPLEIILSDDCSQDATFAIMQSMASAYTGAHSVILNRNKTNLGIARHVNKTFELASGKVWIGAAGDDISLPERTTKIMSIFNKHPDTTSVVSFARVFGLATFTWSPYFIDRRQGAVELCWNFTGALGCSTAYKTSLYRDFGPILLQESSDDVPMLFRSMLVGRHRVITESLVLYRAHYNSSTNATASVSFETVSRLELAGLRQIQKDIKTAMPQSGFIRFFCHMLIELHILRLKERTRLKALNRTSSHILILLDLLLVSGRVCRLRHPLDWARRRFLVKCAPGC